MTVPTVEVLVSAGDRSIDRTALERDLRTFHMQVSSIYELARPEDASEGLREARGDFVLWFQSSMHKHLYVLNDWLLHMAEADVFVANSSQRAQLMQQLICWSLHLPVRQPSCALLLMRGGIARRIGNAMLARSDVFTLECLALASAWDYRVREMTVPVPTEVQTVSMMTQAYTMRGRMRALRKTA